MREAIVEKVNQVILKGIKSEPEALYVVAQIRKYLEQLHPREESYKLYPTLSLFGDWVLHAKLTGSGAKMTLKEYEAFFEKQQGHGMFEFMQDGFTLFSRFHKELLHICEQAGFTLELVTSRKVWLNFINHLVGILKDLPLEGDGAIESFTFTDNIREMSGILMVSFTIKFRDGGSKNFSVDLELLDTPRG